MVLIKVVDFSIKFDKNFVSKKNFFHTHGFLTLEDALLTRDCCIKNETGLITMHYNHVFSNYMLNVVTIEEIRTLEDLKTHVRFATWTLSFVSSNIK